MKSDKKTVIALAGNPNVGKSTLFNELTGLHQHTGNWPGKTVAIAEGICKKNGRVYKLIDLPGTYSLSAHSAEEELARDFINSGESDAVVVVCDATCLERSLILALQIISMTNNVIVCINLMDEARKKGIVIDSRELSISLGVPVVETAARSRKGISSLLDCVDKLSEKGNEEEEKTELPTENFAAHAAEIAGRCISGNGTGYTKRARRIDKVLTSRAFGFPLMLFMLALIFWITIEGANYPSGALSKLFTSLEAPFFDFLLYLKLPDAVCRALVFGVWRVLSWVVAVMLPPMAIFFPLFTLLEDLGYLPRVAFNLDRAFRACSSCGKQSLTMCMGFGCNAAGVVGCRIIDSPRERIIAMLTNSFVPCNGRFPALITLIGIFFLRNTDSPFSSLFSALLLTLIILFGISATFAASKLLSKTFARGEPSSFALELPPYRRPQIVKVIIRSVFDRTLFVLGRAICISAPAGLIIWLLANTFLGGVSTLSYLAGLLYPFGKMMGLDGVILICFILGLPANEIILPLIIMTYTANGTLTELSDISSVARILSENGWTALTALNTMLFSLCHWPCATTLMTIKKESGSIKWTLLAALLPTAFGIAVCLLTRFISALF
ncbi:MAG: ferrous iron transporter B [Oscillospiraceae bacterium]|nr:ferrous iron transporter B [Oscillospiraceae bacterium]